MGKEKIEKLSQGKLTHPFSSQQEGRLKMPAHTQRAREEAIELIFSCLSLNQTGFLNTNVSPERKPRMANFGMMDQVSLKQPPP